MFEELLPQTIKLVNFMDSVIFFSISQWFYWCNTIPFMYFHEKKLLGIMNTATVFWIKNARNFCWLNIKFVQELRLVYAIYLWRDGYKIQQKCTIYKQCIGWITNLPTLVFRVEILRSKFLYLDNEMPLSLIFIIQCCLVCWNKRNVLSHQIAWALFKDTKQSPYKWD